MSTQDNTCVVDLTVEGDGSDLKSFINDRWNIFDADLQLKSDDHEE
jgi:hypothetical protein